MAEAIIRKFAIENISLFISEKYDKKKIKDAKRRYFIDQLKNKFGSPRNKEIADILIKQLIFINKFKDFKELNEFRNKHNFFRDNIHDLNKYEPLFEQEKPDISREDIRKLKIKDTLLRERAKIKDEIIITETKDIQEKIDKKQKEFYSIPSILDGDNEEEPTVKKVKKQEIIGEWWERFNLTENPFKVQEGLAKFSEDIYDDIVFKTPIYDKYLNRALNNEKELLDIARPLLGQWGGGKTTLTDYLGFVLLENKIKFLRIVLPPRHDSTTLYILFENKMFNKLKSFFSKAKPTLLPNSINSLVIKGRFSIYLL